MQNRSAVRSCDYHSTTLQLLLVFPLLYDRTGGRKPLFINLRLVFINQQSNHFLCYFNLWGLIEYDQSVATMRHYQDKMDGKHLYSILVRLIWKYSLSRAFSTRYYEIMGYINNRETFLLSNQNAVFRFEEANDSLPFLPFVVRNRSITLPSHRGEIYECSE